MKIVSLKLRPRKRDVYRVEFHDRSSVDCDAEVVVRFKLKNGLDLSDRKCEELRRESDFVRGRKLGVAYAALELKSSGMIRRYLERKELNGETVARVMEYLDRQGYLNDREFGRRFLESRMKRRPAGVLKLIGDLESRGLAHDLIEDLVQPYRDEDLQMEAARKCLAKKLRRPPSDPKQLRQKATANLRAQGFEAHVCRAAVAERMSRVEAEYDEEIVMNDDR